MVWLPVALILVLRYWFYQSFKSLCFSFGFFSNGLFENERLECAIHHRSEERLF